MAAVCLGKQNTYVVRYWLDVLCNPSKLGIYFWWCGSSFRGADSLLDGACGGRNPLTAVRIDGVGDSLGKTAYETKFWFGFLMFFSAVWQNQRHDLRRRNGLKGWMPDVLELVVGVQMGKFKKMLKNTRCRQQSGHGQRRGVPSTASTRSPSGEPASSGSARSRRSAQHIKKPLNAFMVFMKEMRQTVIDECTLKESAAINQILGRRVSNPPSLFHNLPSLGHTRANKPLPLPLP